MFVVGSGICIYCLIICCIYKHFLGDYCLFLHGFVGDYCCILYIQTSVGPKNGRTLPKKGQNQQQTTMACARPKTSMMEANAAQLHNVS